MTTYTFTGLKYTSDGGVVTSIDSTTLQIVVSDDYRLRYSSLGVTGFLQEIQINTAAGARYALTIDGVEITGTTRTMITRVDEEPGGQAADTNLIEFNDPENVALADTYYLFQLSGVELALPDSPAQLQDLFSTTNLNTLWTRPFTRDTPIDLDGFNLRSGFTENDVIDLSARSDGTVIRSGRGNDTVTGTGFNDVVVAGTGNDRAFGAGGSDRMSGDDGNDRLSGDLGRDQLNGGAGQDLLDGGAGNDRLTGGTGADRFVFATGSDRDVITDFRDGIDKIDLTAFGLNQRQVLRLAEKVGTSVVIDFGDGDVLVIQKTTEASLKGDFILG